MNLMYHGPDEAVCEILESGPFFFSEQEALDLIAETGFRPLLLSRAQIVPEFFDLSTRIAGNILQKCVQYKVSVAIWGDFSDASSALRDFIRESNKGRHVFFLESKEEALAALLNAAK